MHQITTLRRLVVQENGRYTDELLAWVPNKMKPDSYYDVYYDRLKRYEEFLKNHGFSKLMIGSEEVEEISTIGLYALTQDHYLTIHPVIVAEILTEEWDQYLKDNPEYAEDLVHVNVAYRDFAEAHPIFNPKHYSTYIAKRRWK